MERRACDKGGNRVQSYEDGAGDSRLKTRIYVRKDEVRYLTSHWMIWYGSDPRDY